MALKKGKWSPKEDRMLTEYIKRYGIWTWSKMPKPAGLSRSGKSCRLRWVNYLSPDVKRGKFTREEEETITRMQQELGNKWSTIAAALPGRSDNEIKNHWHTHLRRRPRQPVPKQPQATSTVIVGNNIINPSELHLPVVPIHNYVEPPILSFPYILDSSAETSNTTIGTSASESERDANFDHFANYSIDDFYLENQKQVFDESSGLVSTYKEYWDPEPMSPYRFYSNSYTSCHDLWTDLPVTEEDVDRVLNDPIFHI